MHHHCYQILALLPAFGSLAGISSCCSWKKMSCKPKSCKTNWSLEPGLLIPAQCHQGNNPQHHPPARPPDCNDGTNQVQAWIPYGYLQPPRHHKRKQKCLPINRAGFIKHVFWFEAKLCSVVLSLFIRVFHSLYQLSTSDLWALWGLSHTNSTFICSQIYNQATKPPHLPSIWSPNSGS